MVNNFIWKRRLISDLLKIKKDPEKIIGLREDVSYREATQVMKAMHTHSVVVDFLDGKSGMATTKDVSDAVAENKDPDETELGAIATKTNLREVREDATIEEGLLEMAQDGFVRHLRIVDRTGKLKAIVSVMDFILDLLKFESLLEHQNQ